MQEIIAMNDFRVEPGKDPGPVVKWIAAVLAGLAFALGLWLTVQKLTGKIDTLAGCGAGSGCANVLGSKWSMVFGIIPVSVFSCLLYLAIMASLWLGGPLVRWLRSFAAWLLIGAAVWFTLLQLFVLKAICPYCMTMHGVGVALGMVLLLAGRRAGGSTRQTLAPLPLAVLAVAGLAVIQHFGPEPESHRVEQAAGAAPDATADPGIHAAGQGRQVSFLGGSKSYRVAQLPHMGDPNARHVLVKYFDYTCEGCTKAHGYLEALLAKHPGRYAVIVLPAPLERACNPHLPQGVKDHANACRFGKLALRVWRADPAAFAEFHRWLFAYHAQPYEVAEAMAYSLVEADKLEAVDTAWVEAVLEQNVADYGRLIKETPVMPKMLIRDSLVVQGVAKDYATFEKLLQDNLVTETGPGAE
jgi:uncharacterized membrane protein/protein-disulfide isomerase